MGREMRIRACAIVLAALGASLPAGAAVAQTSASPQAEPADLVAAAKAEGTVSVYSSLTTQDMAHVSAAFQKEYGIKVAFWRGSSEDIRNRAVAEAAAGRHDVDVIETAGPDMVAMDRKGLFKKVSTAIDSELIAEARRPDRNWTGSRVTIVIGAYNVNEVKDPPKTYEDLKKPVYKGQLAIEAEADWWLMTLADLWGEKKAVDLFKTVVARNGMSARKGHTLLANLTASGETPIALTTYSYKIDQLVRQGAPIKPIDWDPAVADMTGLGVASKAPHPHAALLFRDFFLGKGQAILRSRDVVTVNSLYPDTPAGLRLTFSNPAQWLDQDRKWARLYHSLFIEK